MEWRRGGKTQEERDARVRETEGATVKVNGRWSMVA
jgi:hypothetical protein